MRCFYAEKSQSLDMLYVGGSVSIVSWEPYEAWDEYGIASYVYGKSSLRSFNVKPLVKEALDRQSPSLLVVDLRPFQYTTDAEKEVANDIGLERNMIAYSPNRLDVIDNALAYEGDLKPADTKASFVLDLIRSHGTWRTLTKDSFKFAIPGARHSASKGFMLIRKYEKIHLVSNSAITGKTPVSERAESDLRDFLEYLSGQKCNVLFVVTPYDETAMERREYNYLAKIIEEYGFDYLNFNDLIEEIGIDEDHDFYNTAHLNIFGAEKFTKWFGNYVCERYSIPDRRENPAYANYDDDYDEWIAASDYTKAEVQKLIDEEVAKNAG